MTSAGTVRVWPFEAAEQDGFSFRAVEVWPAGQTPVRCHSVFGDSPAYRSTLTHTFDDDETRTP